VGLREGGELPDIAPTELEILGLPKPQEMSARSLLANYPAGTGEGGKRRLMRIVLDGWGHMDSLVTRARTPVMDWLMERYPHTTLKASGEAVGLIGDRPGNSETGHLHMVAGRRVPSVELRLQKALEGGSFGTNPALLGAIENCRRHDSALHVFGMVSHDSSHGNLGHIAHVLEVARREGLERVYVHGILDRPGEVPAAMLLRELNRTIEEVSQGQFPVEEPATIIGRDVALDRDENYDRIELAYRALVFGEGDAFRVNH
jgi:2,3-bisphosphoglycerate-independent phosphoglycerate mutase